jgi:hypothetical protein
VSAVVAAASSFLAFLRDHAILIMVILALALAGLCRAAILDLTHPPSWRSEAEAMYSVREIVSGEAVFAQAAGGYGPLECLTQPRRCVPGYAGPPLVDPSVFKLQHFPYYEMKFFPGPVRGRTDGGSRRFEAFAVVFRPRTPQNDDRAYCGDSRGEVRRSRGSEPPPVNIPWVCGDEWGSERR